MYMRIAIVGYGNLGQGAELALCDCRDCEAVGVFTRRDPAAIRTRTGIPVYPAADILSWEGKLDVLLLCGGSAADLPEVTPALAAHFEVVDSFDNHRDIPAHFARTDAAARAGGHLALIAAGWDPGLFSLLRLYADAVLPDGQTYTFWGAGVSQGHSDAVRRLAGVRDARAYTYPVPEALEAARAGGKPDPAYLHRRVVYAVAEPGADRARLRQEILSIPGYFAGCDTTVLFISQEEMNRDHAGLPHGGCVLRTGHTGAAGEHVQRLEARLRLDSNPEFTGRVLVACARAVRRLRQEGRTGCLTVMDLPPAALSPLSPEQLRREML